MSLAADYPITVEQGTDFEMPFSMKDPAGVVIDLTGTTGKAQIRRTYSDSVVLAEMVYTVALNGLSAILSMTHQVTSAIPVDEASGPETALTKYAWDFEITWPVTNKVERILQGVASISPEVTR